MFLLRFEDLYLFDVTGLISSALWKLISACFCRRGTRPCVRTPGMGGGVSLEQKPSSGGHRGTCTSLPGGRPLPCHTRRGQCSLPQAGVGMCISSPFRSLRFFLPPEMLPYLIKYRGHWSPGDQTLLSFINSNIY